MPAAACQDVETLYRDHRAWLHAWLARQLGNAFEASDLTQDTFVNLMASRQAERLQEPRAYLTTLAKRLLYNRWRRRDLERAWLEALAALPPEVSPSPEDYALVREAIEAVDQWLSGLAPKVRQAFLLRRLDGMKHTEIAQEMNVSLATVERYLKQALLHLCSLPTGPGHR
ncbi:sigma-70 family RNA polymerase sigma factor [Acidovorax sp. SUPP1855]|uniref:sigma-70 family RNA polymerase sigma factor n=1 Tax=Acidovorax sp. SUPP1855 TaxID=431774 RepID=UPI0023DE4AC4|nr:sigma-70 family RNA polymerase sigma factor [Acidovorax sp. SUPP1855]GKS86611.1 sigma-70 family RNA polymerase sigma factor [Acidovorax sp. SUPP1855]